MTTRDKAGTERNRARQTRLDLANAMIRIISEHGRRFFCHEGRVTRFELDARGRVWLIDAWREKRIYLAYKYWNRGFSEGGTLRALIQNLYEFIVHNAEIRHHFGPWPQTLCGGDLWGYGNSMQTVRDEIKKLQEANRG